MGIPKFFRFISERWPLITQEIDGPEMVEFDNLYLDMNSILHNCTHPSDGQLSHLNDEQMFGAIFAYIDHLFNIIKPKEVFYMAIDGVAPRAKMNQQRSRRFRTAVEAEQNMIKALESGEPLPKEPPFDTNAITPGTEFMAKVTDNLKFYISQKMSTDSNWQNIKVILSGHEVPGEGEHKIMEYIRIQKAQPGYNPNTRHCVYGLDADLIMLGLVSHEPHFSLLREEVTFGPSRAQKSTDLTKQTFYLLHINLIREYLELEFQSLEDELTFKYDFEKVLDDFILVMYVIGNDFLPNLPDLHLNKGAFPVLIETFKEAMRRTDGYLNENGTINLKRLGVWLNILSIFELENFEKGAVDIEWFNKQLDNVSRQGERKRERQGKELLIKQQKKILGLIREWLFDIYQKKFSVKEMNKDDSKIPEIDLPSDFFESDLNLDFIRKFAFDVGLIVIHSKSKNTYTAKLDIDGMDTNETEEDFNHRFNDIRQSIKKYQSGVIVEDEETLKEEKDLYDDKFIGWKSNYYKKKVNFSLDDDEKIKEMTENYVEGLQWVLYYYYKGICSWPWYYRYHYAPRISDIAKGLNIKINFDMGKPFTPFQQLMSVLPARSRELIPVCYRKLMTDPKSPIIDFYPADCDIDMNGKTASWEAVVLLSFVDEKRLIEAMAPLECKLTPEERKRNSFGHDILFHFNPQVKNLIKSPIPSAFPDFEAHATETVYTLPTMEGLKFVDGLCQDVKLGVQMLAGFPTLKTIPFTFNLQFARLSVFQQPSRSASVLLSLYNIHDGLTPEQFAKQFVGEIVYAQWPYLREYKVVYVTDSLMKYEKVKMSKASKVVSTPLESFEISEFNKEKKDFNYWMHNKKGLSFRDDSNDQEVVAAVEDDIYDNKKREIEEPIDAMVYVKRVVGLAPTQNGALIKVFSDKIECYPIQMIIDSVKNKDLRFAAKEAAPIEEDFPKDTQVVFLGGMAYGTPAKVIDHGENNLTIQITKSVDFKEPIFGMQAADREKQAIRYHSSNEAARILKINAFFLSKLTSMYMIMGPGNKKYDVGLGLKFQGRGLKTLGYTKRNERYWEFSDLAINLIKDYVKNFPELFSALVNYKGNSIPSSQELFHTSNSDSINMRLKEITNYLKEKKENLVTVSLNSDSLSRTSIGVVESQIIDYVTKPQKFKTTGVRGIPRSAVLNPSTPMHMLKKQEFRLGDRVLYVLDSGKVPLFSKGIVIGFRSFETSVSIQVLFDLPIMTGNTFDGRLKTQRGLSVDSSALLNLSFKQFAYQNQKKTPNANNKPSVSKEMLFKQKEEEMKKQLLGKKQLLSVIRDESHKHEENKVEIKEADTNVTSKSSDISSENGKDIKIKGNKDAKNIFNLVMGDVLKSDEGKPLAYTQQHGMPMPIPTTGGLPINMPGMPMSLPMPFPMGASQMMPLPTYPYATTAGVNQQQNGNKEDSMRLMNMLHSKETSNKDFSNKNKRGGRGGFRGRGGHIQTQATKNNQDQPHDTINA